MHYLVESAYFIAAILFMIGLKQMASPVTAKRGIVWAGIDNEEMAKTTTSQIDFGSRGGIYAYDTKGIVMLHRDPKAFGRDDSKKTYMAEVLSKPEGMIRFVGDDGRNKTVFYRAMPDEGWVLCLEVDRDEAYETTRAMLNNSILLTLASALVVGLIIILAARAIARRRARSGRPGRRCRRARVRSRCGRAGPSSPAYGARPRPV